MASEEAPSFEFLREIKTMIIRLIFLFIAFLTKICYTFQIIRTSNPFFGLQNPQGSRRLSASEEHGGKESLDEAVSLTERMKEMEAEVMEAVRPEDDVMDDLLGLMRNERGGGGGGR